jgi:hypothetical protein
VDRPNTLVPIYRRVHRSTMISTTTITADTAIAVAPISSNLPTYAATRRVAILTQQRELCWHGSIPRKCQSSLWQGP